jgi:ribosomal protein S19
MTRDLSRDLQAIDRALDNRLVIVRTVVDMQGRPIRTVYRRAVVLPRDAHSQGEK